jgi:hypothetical protein
LNTPEEDRVSTDDERSDDQLKRLGHVPEVAEKHRHQHVELEHVLTCQAPALDDGVENGANDEK